jgi:hypothetical protein
VDNPRGKPVQTLLCEDPRHGGWTFAYYRAGQGMSVALQIQCWTMFQMKRLRAQYEADAVRYMDALLDAEGKS